MTARPLEDHQTVLHKGDFRDAIFLRYLWTPNGLPSLCSCGNHFSTEHSLSCMRGGFRGLLHNEAKSIFYHAFKDAGFKDVRQEPILQPLSRETFRYNSANTDAEARSDISVNHFWRPGRRAFFVRLPLAHTRTTP